MGGACSTYGERRYADRVFVGKPEGRRSLEDPALDGSMILKWIFEKWDGAWTGLIWLRIGQAAGSCECGNEHLSSVKCGELLH
jgi:hypothetical protein